MDEAHIDFSDHSPFEYHVILKSSCLFHIAFALSNLAIIMTTRIAGGLLLGYNPNPRV